MFMIIFIVISIYNILIGNIDLPLTLVGVLLGVLIGFVVGRMYQFKWHIGTQKVISEMDTLGAVVLVAYLIFILSRTWIVGHWLLGPTAGAFSFSSIVGVMIGRVIGATNGVRAILIKKEKYKRSFWNKKVINTLLKLCGRRFPTRAYEKRT